jgi:hypothetical protein
MNLEDEIEWTTAVQSLEAKQKLEQRRKLRQLRRLRLWVLASAKRFADRGAAQLELLLERPDFDHRTLEARELAAQRFAWASRLLIAIRLLLSACHFEDPAPRWIDVLAPTVRANPLLVCLARPNAPPTHI